MILGVMILGVMILGIITKLSVSSIWTQSMSTGLPGSVVTLSTRVIGSRSGFTMK